MKAIQEAKAEDATLEESTLRIETNRNNTAPLTGSIPGPRQNGWARFPPVGRRRRHRNNYRNEPIPPAPAPLPQPLLPPFPNNLNPHPNFQAPAWQPNQNAAFVNNNTVVEAWRNQVYPRVENYTGQGTQIPQPHADLNFARENVRQIQEAMQQNRFDRFNAQNQPENVDFNVDAELDRNARDIEFLIAANRVQDFRADMDRRRSQVRRRNSDRDDQSIPLQYPNPAFFNFARNYQHPGLANQPQVHAQQPQQERVQGQLLVSNSGQQIDPGFAYTNNFGNLPAQDLINTPQFALQRANTWRDQFRPPTPIPRDASYHNRPNNVFVNRGQPLRRRTMPAPDMNNFGNNNATNNDNWDLWNNGGPIQNQTNNINQNANDGGQHNGPVQQPRIYPGFNFF